MGNVTSTAKYQYLKSKNLKETGFENFIEVSSSLRGARIELVTDEACGQASNLLKTEKVNRELNKDDLNEEYDGWLTKRHESLASVTISLCNSSKIVGLDIDTTGFIDSSPCFANVEAYHAPTMTWHALVPECRINADSHNFFDIKAKQVFSNVRLNVAPGGGIARFRVYGEISPDWSDKSKDYNLASANLGARVVRWTDQRMANKPNILLDDGIKMTDGWLTPRSNSGKERNDFILVQLASAGVLESIIIDTTGFEKNTPENVFIQGCFSEETDPHYDVFASWICLVPQSKVSPGGVTTFYLDEKDAITHIRLHLIPDGGIQQIKVIGKPAEKEAKAQLLIEQAPSEVSTEDELQQQEENEIVSSMLNEYLSKPSVEHLNPSDSSPRNSKRART